MGKPTPKQTDTAKVKVTHSTSNAMTDGTTEKPKVKTAKQTTDGKMAVTETSNKPNGIKPPNGNAVNRNGRPPTTSVLRSAMYYQNRIIIPEAKERSPTTSNPSNTGNISNSTSGGAVKTNPNKTDTTESATEISNNAQNRTATNSNDCTLHSTRGRSTNHNFGLPGMETRGIDIVVTDAESDTMTDASGKNSLWKRIYCVLQDNRMKGQLNAESILAISNPQDHVLLKKVLNITFLSIGIALLVAVIVVIIYTTIDSS